MILLHHPYVCICEEGECVIVTTLIIWSHKSDNNSATEVIMGNNSKQDRNPCIHSSILLGFRTGLKKTPEFLWNSSFYTLSQCIVVFFCCRSGWWKCYCFILLTALGAGWVGRGQVTLEQAKKTVLTELLIRTRAKEHKNCWDRKHNWESFLWGGWRKHNPSFLKCLQENYFDQLKSWSGAISYATHGWAILKRVNR